MCVRTKGGATPCTHGTSLLPPRTHACMPPPLSPYPCMPAPRRESPASYQTEQRKSSKPPKVNRTEKKFEEEEKKTPLCPCMHARRRVQVMHARRRCAHAYMPAAVCKSRGASSLAHWTGLGPRTMVRAVQTHCLIDAVTVQSASFWIPCCT